MVHQFVICFLSYMQCQVMTLSAVSHKLTKKGFQILETKPDELTDIRDFGEFPLLPLECSSVVAVFQFVCYLHQEHKATSINNEVQYEMFAKRNVSRH